MEVNSSFHVSIICLDHVENWHCIDIDSMVTGKMNECITLKMNAKITWFRWHVNFNNECITFESRSDNLFANCLVAQNNFTFKNLSVLKIDVHINFWYSAVVVENVMFPFQRKFPNFPPLHKAIINLKNQWFLVNTTIFTKYAIHDSSFAENAFCLNSFASMW